MKMNLQIFVLLVILQLCASTHPKLVIELFRHGARGPLYHKNDSYWQGKEGQLTEIGRAQHLVLGTSVIQQYPHLKKSLEDPSKIYLQSTQFNRTIESLRFHLWGLYHGQNVTVNDLNVYDFNFYKKYQQHKAYTHYNRHNISDIMSFTPAPITVNPLIRDYELLTLEHFSCPKTEQLLEDDHAHQLDFIMELVRHKIRYYTNTSLNSQQVYDVYDLVYANLFEGKAQDDGFHIESKVWNYLKHGAEYFVTYQRWASELQRRLYGMPLLKKIIDFLQRSHDGDLPYDLVVLSAHDVTVFNLMSALGISDPKCFVSKIKGEHPNRHCHYPNFASQVLIELWERNGEPKVRVLYEKEVVNICGSSDGECSLAQIKKNYEETYKDLTLEDILTHCGKRECARDKDSLDNANVNCGMKESDW